MKNEKFFKHFQGVKKAYIVEPYNILLPDHSPKILKRLQTFEAEEDDVYVVTFAKAGTALMQEVVHLLHNGTSEPAFEMLRDLTFPYLEIACWNFPDDFPDSFKLIESSPSPRLIKTHLPYSLMPPKAIEMKCKMIYVARNVKDVVVSYYHFAQKMNVMDFKGEVSDFVELFLRDLVPYCPYFDHVKGFWERRNEPNILFVTYEDMKKDLSSVVRKTAEFLKKTVSDEEVATIVKLCSFENMKANPVVNKNFFQEEKVAKEDFTYLRKGIVGDWKNHFSKDINDKFEKLLDEKVKDPQLKKIIDCPVK
uniref:Amine sulfotransferase n=1 Tax=Hemiscolopendra marginata TaxID=943146 RepID=A0A646QEH4_9MYRI